MKLYRITSPHHAYDLSGTGSKLFGGRWNSMGNAVVYAAGTVSLAMLETMANADSKWLKRPLALNIISLPDHLHIEKTEITQLPVEWKNFPYEKATVEHGDSWIARRLTPVLQVPSAVNSFEHNFLLNPFHPDFNLITMDEVREIKFDLRLLL